MPKALSSLVPLKWKYPSALLAELVSFVFRRVRFCHASAASFQGAGARTGFEFARRLFVEAIVSKNTNVHCQFSLVA